MDNTSDVEFSAAPQFADCPKSTQDCLATADVQGRLSNPPWPQQDSPTLEDTIATDVKSKFERYALRTSNKKEGRANY